MTAGLLIAWALTIAIAFAAGGAVMAMLVVARESDERARKQEGRP